MKAVMLAMISAIVVLGVTLTWNNAPAQKDALQTETHAGCACAATPMHMNKFLIFWQEKKTEGDKEDRIFKVSDRLFDSVQDAWKIVPSNAAEVRIVTVRID